MHESDDADSGALGVGEPMSGEEVLQVGRPRQLPRWLWLAAIAAAVAVVAIVVVTHDRSQHKAAAASQTLADGQHLRNVPLPIPPRDPPLAVRSGAVLDAVAYGQHTWLLHLDRITGLSIAAGRNKTVAIPRLGASEVNGSWHLVLDASTARLWVVLEGTRHGRALEYSLWLLTRLRDVRLPPISGAAAMAGHLYVTSDRQLIDVPPRAALHVVPVLGMTGSLGPVAADPARNRVLVLDYSAPTHTWVFRPRTNQLDKQAVVPFTKASVAVTDQAIWIGGFARSGAALWQVDTPSLTPTGMSPLGRELGPGAVLLAGGTDDFWVASGGGPGLWCVDGRTGTAEQHWTFTPTAVTTDHQRVIAVTDGHAVPLNLRGGCTG